MSSSCWNSSVLLSPDEIVIDMLYLGPGQGCRHVLRCESVGFERQLDCGDQHAAQRRAIAELEDIVFTRFCEGDYEFRPEERQAQAIALVKLGPTDLIEQMYIEEPFLREIVRRELSRRGMMDDDIYRIGLYGNALSKSQAVDLMKAGLQHNIGSSGYHQRI